MRAKEAEREQPGTRQPDEGIRGPCFPSERSNREPEGNSSGRHGAENTAVQEAGGDDAESTRPRSGPKTVQLESHGRLVGEKQIPRLAVYCVLPSEARRRPRALP